MSTRPASCRPGVRQGEQFRRDPGGDSCRATRGRDRPRGQRPARRGDPGEGRRLRPGDGHAAAVAVSHQAQSRGRTGAGGTTPENRRRVGGPGRLHARGEGAAARGPFRTASSTFIPRCCPRSRACGRGNRRWPPVWRKRAAPSTSSTATSMPGRSSTSGACRCSPGTPRRRCTRASRWRSMGFIRRRWQRFFGGRNRTYGNYGTYRTSELVVLYIP